ncbi:Serine/threonine protein phosphatase PP1 isozyme 3 [Tritrichomonas foetus]|uniref:Serine/threonine-protein phosphatase n=1 Tax=Tritrichomonas foetus TaxID=1144522 RepID=A0A1J4J2G6_9EUKA|nr:Serine/threonine protein phosphatase PP1 isozyme 3 [Tritrichomonas foetus]|eukprot:OHS92937.1 Serine/threonine protein phosphatase PP1 isozyme 3 [Tritrichomonas foetus]
MNRIDRILKKLLTAVPSDITIKLNSDDLKHLCKEAIKVLANEPVLLDLSAPLTICGDVHGQFFDLLHFLKLGGPLPDTKYLFLGDYVDRGDNSVETFSLLLALKVKYPDKIWLLRGNHETFDISKLYGFLGECVIRYSQDIWLQFTEVFKWLPIAAVISDRIFCVHGGLSPDLRTLNDIKRLQRPLEVPEQGLITDLLWSDPSAYHSGFKMSDRGASFTYGADVVNSFLKKNDFDLICRAHQVVDAGYEFPFHPNQTVLTVFSAPDYCKEFRNKAAMLNVDEGLKCTFTFIDPNRRESGSALKAKRRPQTPSYGRIISDTIKY